MKKTTGSGASARAHAVLGAGSRRARCGCTGGADDNRYQALFNNMQQGAFLQAADGRLVDVNPKALEIFGLSRREFLRRTSASPSWKIIREDGSRAPAGDHPSMKALRTGAPDTDRVFGVFNARTNACVWVVVNAIPLFRPGDSTPYQVCVTLHDITRRRQAEEQLQLFKQALEGASDAICMATPEGAHCYQNRAFDELFGAAGSGRSRYIDAKAGRAVLAAVKAGGQWSGEVAMRGRDGGRLDILLRACAIRDGRGRVAGLVGFHTDITQRKRDEEALRQSQERYRLLLERAPAAIITMDRQGRIIAWNNGAEKIFGYRAGTMLGRHYGMLIPERLRKSEYLQFDQVQRHDGHFSSNTPYEGRCRRKGGAEFDAEMTFSMHQVGAEPCFTAIMRDISGRKLMEKRLHESEELLRLTFENAPVGIAVFDGRGDLIEANLFCEECFGASRHDLVERGLALFVQPDGDGPDLQGFLADHEGLRRLQVRESRFFADDGRVIYARHYIRGVFEKPGVLSLVIVLTQDITSSKQLFLMGSAVLTKLKDVHGQLTEFCRLLPEEQQLYLQAKSLCDYGLSPMESRVASMLFHGCANRDIARKLRISENTVKHHLTSIYGKCDVKNRLEFCSVIRANRIVV